VIGGITPSIPGCKSKTRVGGREEQGPGTGSGDVRFLKT